jgi:CHAT domain-containing protein
MAGLALAGANDRRAGAGAGEDGILTAAEISTLDLSAVEWAVLSACDTGVGEIQVGEGVSGLRWSFRVAGVHTVITSLWPVEDEPAGAWMKELYEQRLVGQLATAEAMQRASREILKRRRLAGECTHPFFWAAFLAVGDWR